MKVKLTNCGRFIQIVDSTEMEHKQMHSSFKKRIDSWKWHPLVKRGIWDGYIAFIDKYNRIPIGLWFKLVNICEKYKIELDFEGAETLVDKDFSYEEFEEWVWELFKGTRHGKGGSRELRDYQIKAAADTVKYYKSRSELATSAGKTIIMFIVFIYLLDKGLIDKKLVVVPNTSLVIQTAEGFEEYAEGTRYENKFKIQMMGGGKSKEKKNVDIIIGTFQTLTNLPEEFYSDINCVCVDECHTTKSKSVKDIIIKAYDAKYRYGLSGTMGKLDNADDFTFDAYLGPIINKVSAEYLIKNNFATPILVKSIFLDYMPEETKQQLYEIRTKKHSNKSLDGSKLLNLERKLVVENEVRFNYVTDLIGKTTKNTLVLFLDIKYGYGKKVYNKLREDDNGKTVFYIDGGTSSSTREEYKSAMENGSNKILIASFGTFATGISLHNLHHIFFLESYKSDRLIRQSLGRGMRLMEGKEKVFIWDFVDNFQYGQDNRYKNNYLYRHGEERIKTYREQGFPYKRFRVKL